MSELLAFVKSILRVIWMFQTFSDHRWFVGLIHVVFFLRTKRASATGLIFEGVFDHINCFYPSNGRRSRRAIQNARLSRIKELCSILLATRAGFIVDVMFQLFKVLRIQVLLFFFLLYCYNENIQLQPSTTSSLTGYNLKEHSIFPFSEHIFY